MGIKRNYVRSGNTMAILLTKLVPDTWRYGVDKSRVPVSAGSTNDHTCAMWRQDDPDWGLFFNGQQRTEGLAQDCSNSSALLQSCVKPSIWLLFIILDRLVQLYVMTAWICLELFFLVTVLLYGLTIVLVELLLKINIYLNSWWKYLLKMYFVPNC